MKKIIALFGLLFVFVFSLSSQVHADDTVSLGKETYLSKHSECAAPAICIIASEESASSPFYNKREVAGKEYRTKRNRKPLFKKIAPALSGTTKVHKWKKPTRARKLARIFVSY
jgi:hypothetical protein